MVESPDRSILRIEARDGDCLAASFGRAFDVELPAVNKSARLDCGNALRPSPTVCLLCGDPHRADAAGADRDTIRSLGKEVAVVDVSHGLTVRRYVVEQILHKLDALCPVDLHRRGFQPGDVARTVIAGHAVLIHWVGLDNYIDIYVERSLTQSFYDYVGF